MHCVFPNAPIEKGTPKFPLPKNIKYLLCPISNLSHFYFIQIDIHEKRVLSFDGKRHSLEHVHSTVRYILHKYQLLEASDIDLEFPHGWSIKFGYYLIQNDNVSCGPICCYNIWKKLHNASGFKANVTVEEMRTKVIKHFRSLVGKYSRVLIRSVRHIKKKDQKHLSEYCAICYEEMSISNGDNNCCFNFTCGHVSLMHSECINYWTRINGTCYLCGDNAKLQRVEKTNVLDQTHNTCFEGKDSSTNRHKDSTKQVSCNEPSPKERTTFNENVQSVEDLSNKVTDSGIVSNY